MVKKISIFLILFTVISIIFSPIVFSEDLYIKENITTESGFIRFFSSTPLIIVQYPQQDENVKPNSDAFEIPLNVSCTLAGPFGNWQTRRLRGRPIEIELSIVEQPDWCDASIVNPNLNVVVDEQAQDKSKLRLTVTEQAPAFQQGTVKIKATNKEISGIIFKRITKEEYLYDISFEIGYFPMLSYSINNTDMEIPPINETNIPIKIENLGNGATKVSIEIEDIPEKWNITYPKSVILASNVSGEVNEKEVNIKVIPPKEFSTETLSISITSHYLGMPSIAGQAGNLQLILKNDGSFKDEEFNTILLISIILAIVIIIIISIFLKKKFFSKKS